jgi:hypothetical protein
MNRNENRQKIKYSTELVCTRCGKRCMNLTPPIKERYKGIAVRIQLCAICSIIVIKSFINESFTKGIEVMEREIDKLTKYGQR